MTAKYAFIAVAALFLGAFGFVYSQSSTHSLVQVSIVRSVEPAELNAARIKAQMIAAARERGDQLNSRIYEEMALQAKRLQHCQQQGLRVC